jgi:hypothetical protein
LVVRNGIAPDVELLKPDLAARVESVVSSRFDPDPNADAWGVAFGVLRAS